MAFIRASLFLGVKTTTLECLGLLLEHAIISALMRFIESGELVLIFLYLSMHMNMHGSPEKNDLMSS